MPSKYKQIVQDIIKGIETHEFKRGQKLPSIRRLGQLYQCSKDTVQKAMLELKYQNRIYAVEKSGYYILEDQDFQDQTVSLNPADFQELPYEDFRTCLHESLIGRENYLFNYYHQQEGLEELLSSLQELLLDYHVYTKKQQLVITSGSQQALYILSQMMQDEGRGHILLETPTYPRMMELIRRQGIPYRTIERTLAGIDLQELETLFQTGEIRYFYTIPRLHNPLGSTYDLETRKEIVRLAQHYHVYLIEDDYLADFDPQKNLPLHYLDTKERVIYIKSFTPSLFPALRIGGITLPNQLLADFLQHKTLIDYDTNLIMQKALSLYIDNGMFARNTRRLYQKNLEEMEEMRVCLSLSPLSLPHLVSKGKVTIQLPRDLLTPALKHSSLPLSIVHGESQVYLQLHYGSKFAEEWSQLHLLLTKEVLQ